MKNFFFSYYSTDVRFPHQSTSGLPGNKLQVPGCTARSISEPVALASFEREWSPRESAAVGRSRVWSPASTRPSVARGAQATSGRLSVQAPPRAGPAARGPPRRGRAPQSSSKMAALLAVNSGERAWAAVGCPRETRRGRGAGRGLFGRGAGEGGRAARLFRVRAPRLPARARPAAPRLRGLNGARRRGCGPALEQRFPSGGGAAGPG